MKKLVSVVCTALLAAGLQVSPVLAADVTVTLPTFPVTLNGVTIEQSKNQYPMIVYKDITYVPMTWADTRLLGLDSSWTQQTGLVIDKAAEVQDQSTAQSSYDPYKTSTANAKSYKASIASGKITVNGTSINNSKEEYPLLLFRDVTYFPLTWRFAVTEFGWNYHFDMKNGLSISPTGGGNGAVNEKEEMVGHKVTVSESNVTLYDDADKNKGVAQKGEELIVTDTKKVNGEEWYKVMRTSGGEELWIAARYTEKEATSTNSATNANDNKNNNNNSNSNNTTNQNNTNHTISADNVGKTIRVTGTTVNLRANCNTTAEVLGQAKKGDTFTVLAQKTVNNETWYQVKMDSGVKVWIAGWLTEVTTNSSTNKNNSTTTVTNMVGKKVMVNAVDVNLREEPGTNSKIAGNVNTGVIFTVLAQKTVNDNVWYQVKYGSNNVWIASWLADPYTESTTTTTTPVVEKTHLTLKSVKEQGNKTVVTLYHGEDNKYSTKKATENELVLQLENVYLKPSDSINNSYKNGPLKHLQVQDAGNDALKVTLDLQKGAYCTVKADGDNLVITAYNQHEKGESGLEGKVIVLDPGHGGSDPGAIGKVLGVTDADIGLTVAQKLRDMLKADGATVLMTRSTDVRVTLPERSKVANDAEADMFISIHGNSSTNTSANGIQVYYYAPSGNANLYAQSYVRKTLANKVSEGLKDSTGTKSDVRTGNYAVIRETDRPCLLVETGFLSNAAEEALLAKDSYRQKLAQGIYEGIVEYFEMF